MAYFDFDKTTDIFIRMRDLHILRTDLLKIQDEVYRMTRGSGLAPAARYVDNLRAFITQLLDRELLDPYSFFLAISLYKNLKKFIFECCYPDGEVPVFYGPLFASVESVLIGAAYNAGFDNPLSTLTPQTMEA